jgi:hypothetical protein
MSTTELAGNRVMAKEDDLLVKQIASISEIVSEMKKFEELKGKLLDKEDIQVISDKNYTKKSGWRKLALAFGISTEIIRQEIKTQEDGSFIWLFTVRATAPNGRHTECVASCHSKERSFAHLQHDVFAVAQTRATNRAISDLIGCGEISAEEVAPDEVKEAVEQVRPVGPSASTTTKGFIHYFSRPLPAELIPYVKEGVERICADHVPASFQLRPSDSGESELTSVFIKDVPSDSINMIKNRLKELETEIQG